MGLSAASDAVDREPTVDDQLGARNVFGLVAREEQSSVSDIPGVAHPPHRTLLVPSAHHLLGAAAVCGDDLGGADHRCIHHPRQNRVRVMLFRFTSLTRPQLLSLVSTGPPTSTMATLL